VGYTVYSLAFVGWGLVFFKEAMANLRRGSLVFMLGSLFFLCIGIFGLRNLLRFHRSKSVE